MILDIAIPFLGLCGRRRWVIRLLPTLDGDVYSGRWEENSSIFEKLTNEHVVEFEPR